MTSRPSKSPRECSGINRRDTVSCFVIHKYGNGKAANLQVLVSTTLAQDEVPICIGLRLYLPEEWTSDLDRCCAAAVPLAVSAQPKWQIALDEIDRVRRAGVTFGCVLGDAE